ncbi:hypothetical protein [Kitasatospora sp. NPDC097643]|uniref:hypothetical protein n=1 Tax=Kitasatospora sp. NPDC097643 TaxID=3157230 RepID=UPI00331C1C52
MIQRVFRQLASALLGIGLALVAAGRPEEARKAIARARRESAGTARIARVERMLEQPVEAVR